MTGKFVKEIIGDYWR